ncbi:MAG TPA: uracil-DNA glycosylase [Malonomonas sp.]
MPEKLYHECRELISQCRETLTDLTEWGFETVASPELDALPVCPVGPGVSPAAATVCRAETLAELATRLQDCTRCSLCKERQQVVFGVGNPQADLVLVGEAPGREEDEKGFPFVGEAGQLLDRILFAMKLSREDVYICNVIKCRPPRNRDPQEDEIAACEQFLKLQLAAIRPRLIVTLGRFATQTLLQSKDPISQLRGHWHEYEGIPVMPTFHPAFLLRKPAGKREVWEDMKQVMHKLAR